MNGWLLYTEHRTELNMLGILFVMFLSDALFNIWPIEQFSIHFKSVIFEQWRTNNATKNERKKGMKKNKKNL